MLVSDDPAGVCAVVMGKLPVPGRVKTRLVGALSPEQAARVQDLFLRHTLQRLLDERAFAGIGRVVLCFDPPEALAEAREHYGGLTAEVFGGPRQFGVDVSREQMAIRTAGRVEFHPQAGGDLGQRLTAAMGALGTDRPLLFLGADSPDVPSGHLAEACEKLRRGAGIVLGPCDDGGFWCLGVAAGVDLGPVVAAVDWSSGREMAQVRRNAEAARLSVALAPPWNDVDHPADLDNLWDRAGCDETPPGRRLFSGLQDVLRRAETT